MIAGKLIMQSLISVGGVVCIAGGVKYGMSIIDAVPESFVHVVVESASNAISAGDLPKSPLAKKLNNKNYFCSITKQDNEVVKDWFCKIFSANLKTTNPKELDLENVASEERLLKEKDAIKASKNYILKLDSKKYSDNIQKIEIISAEEEEKKIFGVLTPKLKMEGKMSNIKSNFIIVRGGARVISTDVTLDSSKKFMCRLGKETVSVECDLYKPTTDKTTNTFTSTELESATKVTATSDIKADNYYLLHLKGNSYEKNQFINQELQLFYAPTTSTDASETKVANFIYEQVVLASFEPSTSKIAFPVLPRSEGFLVTTAEVDATTDPTAELMTGAVKNYKCQLVGKATPTDESCELFKIKSTDSKEFINFEDLSKQKEKVTTKAELKANKLFKLKINKSNLTGFDWKEDTPVKIELVSKNESGKKYATLNLEFQYADEKISGKTNLLIGKAVATIATSTTINSTNTFKCQIDSLGTKTECEIYKFTTSPTNKETLKFNEAAKITASTDVSTSNYLAINLKSATYKLSKEKPKKIIVFDGTTDTTQLFELNIENRLIGSLTNTTTPLKEIIVIK